MKKFKSAEVLLILLEILSVVCLIVFVRRISMGTKEVPFDELTEAVVSAAETKEGCAQSDAQHLRKYYGLEDTQYEDFILYMPASNMDAEELFLAVMNDESEAKAASTAIEERLSAQKNAFDGYGTDQMALLNDAVVCVKGRYVLFAVCENAADVKKAFLDKLS